MELDPQWHERFMTAQKIGRVMPGTGCYRSGKLGMGIPVRFPKKINPRILYSARGSRFTTR